MRRVEQAEQRRGLVRQSGFGIEIIACQVGKAELVVRRKLPGQIKVDLGGQPLAFGDQLGRGGFIEFKQHIGGFYFDAFA